MSDLVTGEAVVLDLRLARLASRGLAVAIDLLIEVTGLVIRLIILTLPAGELDEALPGARSIVIAVLVFVGYPVTLETLTRGRTVGKLALGLRVVREDGGPIRFRQALVRGLTWFFVDFWVFGLAGAVAIFVSLASTKGKRVGDFLAGTVVIRERIPAAVGPVMGMPPQLRGALAAWRRRARRPGPRGGGASAGRGHGGQPVAGVGGDRCPPKAGGGGGRRPGGRGGAPPAPRPGRPRGPRRPRAYHPPP